MRDGSPKVIVKDNVNENGGSATFDVIIRIIIGYLRWFSYLFSTC